MPKSKKIKKAKKVPPPFEFPKKRHCRVHGPQGHRNYPAYKPWLRDEFQFRCVYCLTRESWSGDGHNRFSIDHVKPKSRHRKLTCEYDNLVYACVICNRWKAAQTDLPDPCETSLHTHLKLLPDGKFKGQTTQGKLLVERLRLNSDQRVADRQYWLYAFERDSHSEEMFRLRFGYPLDLPDLAKLKPPKGNLRPKGLKMSHYFRRAQGKLPQYY